MSTTRKRVLPSPSPSSVKRTCSEGISSTSDSDSTAFISHGINADRPPDINNSHPNNIADSPLNGHVGNPQDINAPANLIPLAGRWRFPNANEISNRFVFLVEQYPILEALVAHLRPKDLVQLAQTCQSNHDILSLDCPRSRSSLLTKALCSGKSLRIRYKKHLISHDSSFSIKQACGGDDDGNDIESRPCTRCGINTCDECRIHLTYNDMVQDDGPGGRRWWAGHIFVFSFVYSLLPPAKPSLAVLKSESKSSSDFESEIAQWHVPLEQLRPLHDQGMVHLRLTDNVLAEPESIPRIVNLQLGRDRLWPKGRREDPYRGDHVIEAFYELALHRQVKMCSNCFWSKRTERQKCVCTLKKRYLDQWICMECDIEDRKAWNKWMKPFMKKNEEERTVQVRCECGRCLDGITVRIVCNWCNNEIEKDPIEEDEAEEDEAEEDEAEEDEAEEGEVKEEDQEANDGFRALHCSYQTLKQLDEIGEATLADGTILF